ncbi:MAG: hypothetical protein V4623_09285 [Pseudomonadota bacterium]
MAQWRLAGAYAQGSTIQLGSNQAVSSSSTSGAPFFPAIAREQGSLASYCGDLPTVARTPESPHGDIRDVQSLFALTYQRGGSTSAKFSHINMTSAAQYTPSRRTLEVALNRILEGDGSKWDCGKSVSRTGEPSILLEHLRIVVSDDALIYFEQHSPTLNPLSRFFSVLSIATPFMLKTGGVVTIEARCFPVLPAGTPLKTRADTNKTLRWPQHGRNTTYYSPKLSVHLLQREPYTEQDLVTTQIITLVKQLCQIVFNRKGGISHLNELSFVLSNFNFVLLPKDKKEEIQAAVDKMAAQLGLENRATHAQAKSQNAVGRYTEGILNVSLQETEDTTPTLFRAAWSAKIDAQSVAEYADTVPPTLGVMPLRANGEPPAEGSEFDPIQYFLDFSALGDAFLHPSAASGTEQTTQARNKHTDGEPPAKQRKLVA